MMKLLRFGVVGAIGFVVDSSVLLAASLWLHVAPLPARMLSFAVAATVIFVLNQRITFGLREAFSVSRWAMYLAATTIGACINIGVYEAWIIAAGAGARQLIFGTALGSLTAMFVNYFVSSTVVFRPAKHVRFAN